jgi:hypothetical protein
MGTCIKLAHEGMTTRYGSLTIAGRQGFVAVEQVALRRTKKGCQRSGYQLIAVHSSKTPLQGTMCLRKAANNYFKNQY